MKKKITITSALLVLLVGSVYVLGAGKDESSKREDPSVLGAEANAVVQFANVGVVGSEVLLDTAGIGNSFAKSCHPFGPIMRCNLCSLERKTSQYESDG